MPQNQPGPQQPAHNVYEPEKPRVKTEILVIGLVVLIFGLLFLLALVFSDPSSNTSLLRSWIASKFWALLLGLKAGASGLATSRPVRGAKNHLVAYRGKLGKLVIYLASQEARHAAVINTNSYFAFVSIVIAIAKGVAGSGRRAKTFIDSVTAYWHRFEAFLHCRDCPQTPYFDGCRDIAFQVWAFVINLGDIVCDLLDCSKKRLVDQKRTNQVGGSLMYLLLVSIICVGTVVTIKWLWKGMRSYWYYLAPLMVAWLVMINIQVEMTKVSKPDINGTNGTNATTVANSTTITSSTTGWREFFFV